MAKKNIKRGQIAKQNRIKLEILKFNKYGNSFFNNCISNNIDDGIYNNYDWLLYKKSNNIIAIITANTW